MQASPNPDDERDLRTMVVADHGVDPSPVPRHKAPARQSAGMGLRDTLIWCGIPVLVILLLAILLDATLEGLYWLAEEYGLLSSLTACVFW